MPIRYILPLSVWESQTPKRTFLPPAPPTAAKGETPTPSSQGGYSGEERGRWEHGYRAIYQASHIRLISYIAMSASRHMLPSSALGPPPAPRANEHVGEGFSTPGGLGTVAVRPSCFCPKEKVASSSAAEGTSSANQNGF